MARLKNGPYNGISGKLGPLVGYVLNGEYLLRMAPKKRTKRRSNSEKNNHTKFAKVQAWLNPIVEFLKTGFNNYGSKTGGYKGAVSYALRNSVEGTYPDQYVNPEKVLVSGGELYNPTMAEFTAEQVEVIRKSKGEQYLYHHTDLDFTWSTEMEGNASDKDQAMLLAYCLETQENYHKIIGNFRSQGNDTLTVHPALKDTTYHVYLGFLSYDRSMQSNSIYLGVVNIPKRVNPPQKVG